MPAGACVLLAVLISAGNGGTGGDPLERAVLAAPSANLESNSPAVTARTTGNPRPTSTASDFPAHLRQKLHRPVVADGEVQPAAHQIPLPTRANNPVPRLPLSPTSVEILPSKDEGKSASGDQAAVAQLQAREPLPLRAPGEGPSGTNAAFASTRSTALTVAGSLALVLGVFLLIVWCFRRANPRRNAVLPQEVFEVLGRAPLAGRQQAYLLRCGQKLLLVSITPGGAETLTEITDPVEVDRLMGLCMQPHPASATTAFRQILAEMSGERRAGRGIDREKRHGP